MENESNGDEGRSRPTKLTPERRDALLKWLRGGLPLETAARLTGVSPSTVQSWRKQSRAGRAGYRNFETEVLTAMAEGEAIHVARIAEAGRGNWRAAAWLLERMHPEKWVPPPAPPFIPDAPPPNLVHDDFPGL